MHVQNKMKVEDRFHIGFSIPNKTMACPTIFKPLQDNKVCSRLISNSPQHCPCQPWAECSLPRRIRGVQVEAAEEVSLLQEGLTGFQTTSTGSLRSANWGPGRLSWQWFDCSQTILFRRQNKSGKSSAESEGSPDEVLIWNFVIETCLCLDSNSQLDKTKDISATFEGGRQWEEKARGADGQFAATEVFPQLSSVSHIFFAPGLSPTLRRGRRRSQRQTSGRRERGS